MSESGFALGREMIATTSPIRHLLKQADEIGAVYRLDGFREALIVTNDLFVADAYGIPQHAFLLACLRDLTETATAGSVPAEDCEVILLRVCDTRALPDDGDMERLRARLGRDLVTENRRTDENRRTPDQLIDALTESEIQTFGLSCAVLGTFHDDDDDGTLAFGSDMDNIYAARRLLVYKPYGESLKRIVSFLQLMTDEPPMKMPLGTLRYASTRRRERIAAKAPTPKPTNVDVEVNIADFVAHKTAVFGMTRLGKSNTMKVIATAVFRYGKTQGVKIGQLIFDPASEYASENPQDHTALANLGAEHVRRYRFGATQAELDEDNGLRPLALNFFNEDEIGPVWDLIGDFATAANSAQYVTAFAHADVVGPTELIDGDDRKQHQYARRARLMLYATLIKAGLEPPPKWTYWAPTNSSLRTALAGMQGPRGEDLSFISTLRVSRHGSVPLDAKRVLTVAEAIAVEGFADNPNQEVADWFNVPDERVKHVANVLLAASGGGYKILMPLSEGYHSPAATDDYAPQIYRDLVAGRIVIVDLSRGSEGVLQFASERIINHVLGRAAEKFRNGKEADVIQIFLEEAHRLFDRERFRNAKHTADPYVRLAREAAKYKIGMIYSTQQVSSVETDVLDNTANWIIAHLNSEGEVKLLRGRYEFGRFAEQILTAEDRGFVRLKTLSSRFVVPLQVRKFDALMIDEAREAAAKPPSGSNGDSAVTSAGAPAEQ